MLRERYGEKDQERESDKVRRIECESDIELYLPARG